MHSTLFIHQFPLVENIKLPCNIASPFKPRQSMPATYSFPTPEDPYSIPSSDPRDSEEVIFLKEEKMVPPSPRIPMRSIMDPMPSISLKRKADSTAEINHENSASSTGLFPPPPLDSASPNPLPLKEIVQKLQAGQELARDTLAILTPFQAFLAATSAEIISFWETREYGAAHLDLYHKFAQDITIPKIVDSGPSFVPHFCLIYDLFQPDSNVNQLFEEVLAICSGELATTIFHITDGLKQVEAALQDAARVNISNNVAVMAFGSKLDPNMIASLNPTCKKMEKLLSTQLTTLKRVQMMLQTAHKSTRVTMKQICNTVTECLSPSWIEHTQDAKDQDMKKLIRSAIDASRYASADVGQDLVRPIVAELLAKALQITFQQIIVQYPTLQICLDRFQSKAKLTSRVDALFAFGFAGHPVMPCDCGCGSESDGECASLINENA